MSETFSVAVDENWNFDLNPQDATGLDLIQTGAARYHLVDGNQSMTLAIRNTDFLAKSYEIEISGKTYTVRIADALDQQISSMGFRSGSNKDISEIRAPMPGLILDIPTAAGATVKEGDPLLILEAMKMENVISSPREGVIKKICVNKGAAVDKKALLLEFE